MGGIGARFHPRIFMSVGLGVNTDRLLGTAGNRGYSGPRARPTEQRARPTEQRAQSQPTPSQWGSSVGMNDVAGAHGYFSGERIFEGRCPRLMEDGADLTSHCPADRTPGWNTVVRV